MKIISWNVNGIRAVVKKDFYKDLEKLAPDILCLQETKAQDEQVTGALAMIDPYELFSNSAVKKGYSGTAVLTKIKPISISRDMGIAEHDKEGRVLCLEFQEFYLVNVYTPNSGNDLNRLEYRQEWDRDFFNYLKKLENHKPVITCGDFNVAHREIDLARPKPNYNKSAGFMQEEIDGMDRYIGGGFVDTFRHYYPDTEGVYSWWSFRAGARAKNVGWRIDYFLVSRAFISAVRSAAILNEIMGSDHCPVQVELDQDS